MTDSNLTLEKDSSQEEELYSFERLYKNMPADIYANTSSSLDWNQLVNKEDSINRFYLNDNDEDYVDENNNNNALRQVAGISTEIGTGIGTDYATAPLLLAGPKGWAAYALLNFASGYSSNVAAQKIRGEDKFSYGEAFGVGFFQMLPYGSTGKGIKGLAGAGLQGATTATGELTVRTAIDEKRLPTKEEYAVSGTIGTVFGTGFKGTLDGLSSLYKKYNGKSAAEIDKVITKKEKNLIDKLLTDTAEVAELSQDKAIDLRLFKEGKYDVYRDGPVVVERIPEDPSLMPSINVKAIEDLGDIELKEFGLTKKEFSNLSTQKKVSLLKNSFERTREVLPPGKYELFGSTEKKRSIYARWFKNDSDIEWLDIETNQPAKPGKDSYAVLTVKEPTFEEWVKNPPEEYRALFKEIEETSKSADENIARSKQLFKEIQSGLDEQDRLLKEGSQYDQLSPTDQKKVDLEVSLRGDAGGGGAVPPRKPPSGSSGADVPPVDPTDPKVQSTFNPKFLPDLDVEKLILDEAEKIKNLDASGQWPYRRTFKDMVNSANQLLPKEVIEQARLFSARYGRGGESDLPATLIAMNRQMNRNAIALDNVAKAIENTVVTGNKEGFAELKEQLIRETKTLDGLITLNKPLKTIPAQTLAANKAAGGLADTVATADDLAGRQVVQGAMEDASKEISEVTVKAQETLQEILDAAEKGDVASIRKIRKITKRIQAAGGDPEKLRKMIRPDYMKKGFEINNELFINAILSGPETHAVNVLSTALNTVVRPVDQILGSAVTADMTGMIRGGKELYYLTTAVSDSWKMARAAFRTENNILNAGAMIDDREAAKRFAIRMDGEGTVANLVNGFGRFVRYSGRFLLAEDEFFKQLNFRSYVKASAWENGVRNGLEGDKLKQYIKDQFDSTIEIVNKNSMKDVKDEALLDLYDKAQQYAAETTFTADLPKGSFGGDVQSFINKHPSARTFFPFIRTPINIFKAQMRRTVITAPFMDEFKQALKSSDPSIAAKARGELIVGSTIWTVGISTATAINDPLSEVAITGGGPADYKFLNQMRETGWQPYSFRFLEKDKDGQPIIGQDGKPKYKYVSYKRFDPWASFLMMSADMAAIMGQLNKEDREDLATVAGVAMARNITNKTYLQGVSELAQILSEDWKQIGNWLPKRIAATVPYSALGRSIKKAADPTIMDKRIRPGDEGMIALRKLHNELAVNIPGYGNLKPIQNFITGSLVEYPPGYGPDIMNIMNPIKETNSLNNSVLTTLVDIGARIEKPKDVLFGGIKLNSDQYSDLVNDIAFVKIGGQRMVYALHKTMQRKDVKALLATARGENITAANQDISVAAQEEARADAEQIFRKIINTYKKAGREQWIRKPENRDLALKYDAEINAINEARSNSVLDNFKQLQGATN